MTDPAEELDEYDLRYRALAAERLRPIPDPPLPPEDDPFAHNLAAFEKRLQRFGELHHPDLTRDTQEATD